MIKAPDPVRASQPLHPSYVLLFGAWMLSWMLFEMLKGALVALPWVGWTVFAQWMAWLAIELAGARRVKDEGDTWSELWWWLHGGRPARTPLARMVGTAMALRAASIPYWVDGSIEGHGESAWLFWLYHGPWWLLMLGVALWLWRHLPELGASG